MRLSAFNVFLNALLCHFFCNLFRHFKLTYFLAIFYFFLLATVLLGTIPAKKSQIFSTAADNQTSVEVNVLQGEREMAAANKSLGRFHLDGIAPARRGVPQIEVTFDIDANGIVNVSAKDLGTGKEQHITITSSSNMSKEDIDKAVKEAEQYAAEDARIKESVEARNNADQMVYQAEKTLGEMGDKIDEGDKAGVQSAIDKLKETLKGEDTAAIKADTEALQRRSSLSAKSSTSRPGPRRAGLTWAARPAARARTADSSTMTPTTRSWTTTRTSNDRADFRWDGEGIPAPPPDVFRRLDVSAYG